MAIDATIVEPQPLLLAAIRRHVTAGSLANTVISAPVWAMLAERGQPNTGRTVVIYWNDEHHSLQAPAGVPIDVGVEVDAPMDLHPALSLVQTPTGRAASYRHVGPYQALHQIHGDLRSWCDDRGERLVGVSWEVFDYFDEDPTKCETRIFYLLG